MKKVLLYLLIGIKFISFVSFRAILLLHLLYLPIVLVLGQVCSHLGIAQLLSADLGN